MNIKFLEKDQIWQNETTNYWFEVDGENWAISDNGYEISLLDCDGCPTINYPEIKERLLLEYQKRIND